MNLRKDHYRNCSRSEHLASAGEALSAAPVASPLPGEARPHGMPSRAGPGRLTSPFGGTLLPNTCRAVARPRLSHVFFRIDEPLNILSDASAEDLTIWTLGGGSLGSCVDEERSQLRELM